MNRASLLIALLIAAAGSICAQDIVDADGVIRVETSMDLANTFVYDEAPRFEDGRPSYGNDFIIRGVLYPAGTVTAAGSKGMNPDGTPEFPGKVIGEWTCWGRFIGNGAQTAQGAFVVSTQIFSFGEMPGYGPMTIVTTGYETVDGSVLRTITGGTGQFNGAAGTQRQAIMAGGRNAANGLNLTHEITLDDEVTMSLAKIKRLLDRVAIRLGLVP